MLVVSHNEGDISTLCDEVYEFDGAKIKTARADNTMLKAIAAN